MLPISSLLKRAMHFPSPSNSEGVPRPDAPPAILIAQGRDPAGGPRYVPTSRLVVTPHLRTSGLLAALPDESARTLLGLLTFLTPDGRLQANALQLAEALGLSERISRKRMENLASLSFEGRSVTVLLPYESGMDAIVLSPHLFSYEEEGEKPPAGKVLTNLAGRSAVISHSRSAYARPRAEVERMVRVQLGYAPSDAEDTPEARVRRSLRAFGIPPGEMEELLSRFPVDRIERQIEWMGYRKAKRPRSYLLAAIENDYAPPVEVRLTDRKGPESAHENSESSASGSDNKGRYAD